MTDRSDCPDCVAPAPHHELLGFGDEERYDRFRCVLCGATFMRMERV